MVIPSAANLSLSLSRQKGKQQDKKSKYWFFDDTELRRPLQEYKDKFEFRNTSKFTARPVFLQWI